MKMIHVWFSQSWLEYLSILSATPTPRKLFFFVYKLRGHVTWATWAYRGALAWPARLLPKIKSWNTAQWKFGIVKSFGARFRWLFNVDLCKWFRLPKVQNHLPNTNSVNYRSSVSGFSAFVSAEKLCNLTFFRPSFAWNILLF